MVAPLNRTEVIKRKAFILFVEIKAFVLYMWCNGKYNAHIVLGFLITISYIST